MGDAAARPVIHVQPSRPAQARPWRRQRWRTRRQPSPPRLAPTANPPTDSQAHGRPGPHPCVPMANGHTTADPPRISPPLWAAPAYARPR